ncbi:hypothetical protein [Nocardia sp. NPDC005998]|uniref:hypothetical protein n=1 Tax=Nocardia sp. NPDC005998 TaxID=3156894 RepID=UPI0033B3BDB8
MFTVVLGDVPPGRQPAVAADVQRLVDNLEPWTELEETGVEPDPPPTAPVPERWKSFAACR